ncbi:MFS transporter [Paraburkholderia fungorum]
MNSQEISTPADSQTTTPSNRKLLWNVFPRNVHPYAWWALFATWSIWAVNSMDIVLVQVLGPSIVKEFNVSGTTMGNFVAATFFIRAVIDLPASWISDQVGNGWRRKFFWAPVIISYAAFSTLSVMHALSATIGMLFFLRAFVNVGSAACETVGVASTAEWWSQENRGFAVGLHHTGFPIGVFLAGQVVAIVLSVFGNENWRYAFCFSLLSLPFVGLYWWLATRQKYEAVQRAIVRAGERPWNVDSESASIERAPLRALFRNRQILIAATYTALTVPTYFMFSVAYPLYLAFVGGYSFAQVASYSVVWTISAAIFQLLLPSWSDRIGRKPILVVAGFYSGFVLLLLPYATSGTSVFLIQILYGVVQSAVYPICFSVCADSAPKGRIATAVSLSTSLLWASAAVAVLCTGRLIDFGGGFQATGGYLLVFKVMSALAFASGLLYLFAKETAPLALARRQAKRG